MVWGVPRPSQEPAPTWGAALGGRSHDAPSKCLCRGYFQEPAAEKHLREARRSVPFPLGTLWVNEAHKPRTGPLGQEHAPS